MISLREYLTEDYVTKKDLSKIEAYMDALLKSLGLDLEFSHHFIDRVNDARNKKPITVGELAQLFAKQYRINGPKIAQLGPPHEAVLKDLSNDLNLPIALKWDKRKQMVVMLAQTIMRKKNFIPKNNGKVFAVENRK